MIQTRQEVLNRADIGPGAYRTYRFLVYVSGSKLPPLRCEARAPYARSMADHNQADHIHHAMSDSPLRRLGPRYTRRRGMLEGRGAAVSDLRKSSSGGFTATPTVRSSGVI